MTTLTFAQVDVLQQEMEVRGAAYVQTSSTMNKAYIEFRDAQGTMISHAFIEEDGSILTVPTARAERIGVRERMKA